MLNFFQVFIWAKNHFLTLSNEERIVGCLFDKITIILSGFSKVDKNIKKKLYFTTVKKISSNVSICVKMK